MRLTVVALVFASVSVRAAAGARILALPVDSRSHVLQFRALLEDLTRRGHEVFMALPTVFEPLMQPILKGSNFKLLTYRSISQEHHLETDTFDHEVIDATFGKAKLNWERMTAMFLTDCHEMMEDTPFINAVKNLRFDLAVVDSFAIVRCKYILPSYLGLPYVSYSSVLPAWILRNPILPSVVPLAYFNLTQEMTFRERIQNILGYLALTFPSISHRETHLIYKYAKDKGMESWDDMVRKSEIFFWNSDPILGYAIPLTPNIIPIGGITAHAGRPLPRDLDVFMDQSKEGVVVVSFGSVISALPDNVLAKFAEAFSSLKENVVWRFKHVPRFEVPANVRLVKWLPQNDLLAHPNTKLFVTHCGNNGQYEAFYHGIPMLATPLVWDQLHNAVRINSKGFGLILNINSFSVDQMSSKMKEILYNPKYTKAIKIASRRFRSLPQTPREKASFWIEYVIKHGDCSHLHSPALTMPWYQLIMLDIGATVFLSVSLLTTVLLAFLYICVIRMRRVKEKTL